MPFNGTKSILFSSYHQILFQEADMEIKPVKDSQPPRYPRKEDVGTEQIKASLPRRWVKSPVAKIALASLAAMTLAGCELLRTAGMPAAPSILTEETVTPTPFILEGEAMAPTVNVAPLFTHGEGLGAFGCMMVAPPAFLSEDEALSVINSVAKQYGLTFFAQGAPELEGVLQPVTNIYESDNKAEPDTLVSLTPDFADAAHGVSIEFVSVEDVKSWHQETGYAITVESYDTQDAAAQLSEALESAATQDYSSCTVGVLYDPCGTAEDPAEGEEWEAAEAKNRALSIAQLSAQVKDFCEWLKAQGII
jgi:hypothetical protein